MPWTHLINLIWSEQTQPGRLTDMFVLFTHCVLSKDGVYGTTLEPADPVNVPSWSCRTPSDSQSYLTCWK